MIGAFENETEYLKNLDTSYEFRLERQMDLPQKVKPNRFEQSEIPEGESPFRHFSKIFKVPCWRFSDGTHTIKSDLPVAVEFSLSDYGHCAMNESLDIYAMGKSSIEAYNDFSLQLVHFYFHYINTPDENLGPKAIEFKNIFSKHFSVK